MVQVVKTRTDGFQQGFPPRDTLVVYAMFAVFTAYGKKLLGLVIFIELCNARASFRTAVLQGFPIKILD